MRTRALARPLNRSLRRVIGALGALALAAALAPGAASAAPKPCSASERKAAGGLADKGFEQFEAADYKAAIEFFEQAEEKCHSPRLLIFLGLAHARSGKLLRARELFQQAADEPITPRSPASFREAQIEARKELEALKPRIPVLQLTLSGASASEAQVTLDDEEADVEELQRGRELDPGKHTLVVEAPGIDPTERRLILRESVVERIEIVLRTAEAPPPPQPEGDRPSLAPPIIALGLGAVGVGVGVITGAMSSSAVSDIKSRCEGNQCLRSDAPAADRAETLGNVSTAAFILGGVGLAAGAALLILRPGDDDGGAPASAGSARAAPRLTLGVGPGSLHLGGTF